MLLTVLTVAASLLPRETAPALEGVLVTPELTFSDPADLMRHQGYKVLIFYPHDFTFVCPTELLAFSERIKEFEALGVQLVGISVDSHFTHLAWMSTPKAKGGVQGLKFPLLSDLNKVNAENYGVLVPRSDSSEAGKALRGMFVLDERNRVRVANINDLPVGRSVDETIRLVKAFQHVDKHGEGCPAGWQPGAKTIKTDPWGSREYFEALEGI